MQANNDDTSHRSEAKTRQQAAASGTSSPKPPDDDRRLKIFIAAVVIGLLALFVVMWFRARGPLQSKERVGAACFHAMFARDFDQAIAMFREFRELAEEDIPPEVRDEFMALTADRFQQTYPIYPREANPHQLWKTVSGSQFARAAFEGATTAQDFALAALRYVRINMQADPTPIEEQPVLLDPVELLHRGYGDSLQMSWVMAHLLRNGGLDAAVGYLPASDDEPDYGIVGVVIDRRMYLFDPFRGVPLCRAADGRVADLESLLSGEHELVPGFGGPGSPVRLDRLRRAAFFVPADSSNVTPDAWLLDLIFKGGGWHNFIYRPVTRDIRQIGAAVFGDGARLRQPRGNYWVLLDEESELRVGLWPFPFLVDQAKSDPQYADRLVQAYPHAPLVWDVRSAQLLRDKELNKAVRERYAELRERHEDNPEFLEDLTFFSTRLASYPGEQAGLLAGYLEDYPDGRWRPLATMMRAELEAQSGRGDVARGLTARIEPPSPYALRARLLEQVVAQQPTGRAIIRWQFPETDDEQTSPEPAR